MNKAATLFLSIVILLPLLGLIGCETESSSQASITISPNSVTLGIGGSQEFVASGWTDYTWSLSDTSAGVLSTTTGDTTTYTAVAGLSSSNAVQVLTCTGGTTTTSTGTGTNTTTTTTTTGPSATALIQHQ